MCSENGNNENQVTGLMQKVTARTTYATTGRVLVWELPDT